MRKRSYKIIGVSLIIAGIATLVFGLFVLRYRAQQFHSIITDFGILSVIVWLSIVVAGIMFLRIRRRR